jgi:hypothetical protein
VQALVASLNDEQLSNPFNLFANVVCKLYYSNPIYLSFLNAFEQYARLHPEAPPRELAIYSLIEVAAEWLAQQAVVTDFTPNVDPSAVLAETVSAENDDVNAAVVTDAIEQPQVELIPEPVVEQAPAAAPAGYTMQERLDRLQARRDPAGVAVDAQGTPVN